MDESRQTAWHGRHSGKDQIRAEVWAKLKQHGVARGDPVGHIPNVVGSDEASARLAALPVWQQARIVKCNPDAAQAAVRLRALQEGKILYMAVPRLAQDRCFVELAADRLQAQGTALETAATHRGAMQAGRLVAFAEMMAIDLVVVGCVAVSRDGGRAGKGAGFADIELGILRQFGLVQPQTPIVTTVHPLQIVSEGRLPMLVHDWSLTWIATPEQVWRTSSQRLQPAGLMWTHIQPEQWETIPVLRRLQDQKRCRRNG
jgi:5-formyltetrahydrofolate cyclo-ligase